MQTHRFATHLGLCALAFVLQSSAAALTPQQEFESDALLNAAKSEIRSLSADQIEATIQYLSDCAPLPSAERDQRCERAATVLSIKTSNEIAFESVRAAIFIVDKVAPWSRPNRSARDERLLERRVKLFSELRAAASERYRSLRQ